MDRYQTGLALLCQLENTTTPALLAQLQDTAPDLARLTIEFGYGDILSRPGLSPRQRQLATLAMLAARGNARPQLLFHLRGTLNIGVAVTEICETLIHLAPYCGFPAVLNGLSAAREVLAERQLLPVRQDHMNAPADRLAAGRARLAEIDGEAGQRVIDSLQAIAPDLAHYIIAFGFGDIYGRPGLDLRTRELVTIAALAAMGNAAPQLDVHLHAFLNVGGTRTEMVETLMQVAVYAGLPAAINALLAAAPHLEHA